MFKNLIVGVDGEDGGRDAIALANVLIAEGGRLTLANVYPGERYVWRGGSPPSSSLRRTTRLRFWSARETRPARS